MRGQGVEDGAREHNSQDHVKGDQEAARKGQAVVLGSGMSGEVMVSCFVEARPGWALRMCSQRECRKGRREHEKTSPAGWEQHAGEEGVRDRSGGAV